MRRSNTVGQMVDSSKGLGRNDIGLLWGVGTVLVDEGGEKVAKGFLAIRFRCQYAANKGAEGRSSSLSLPLEGVESR